MVCTRRTPAAGGDPVGIGGGETGLLDMMQYGAPKIRLEDDAEDEVGDKRSLADQKKLGSGRRARRG